MHGYDCSQLFIVPRAYTITQIDNSNWLARFKFRIFLHHLSSSIALCIQSHRRVQCKLTFRAAHCIKVKARCLAPNVARSPSHPTHSLVILHDFGAKPDQPLTNHHKPNSWLMVCTTFFQRKSYFLAPKTANSWYA